MADRLTLPFLACPACRVDPRCPDTPMRIGNRRGKCETCNAFVQNVMRLTRKRLLAAHPEEYDRIRASVEADLYPQVLENFVLVREWETSTW